MIWSVREQVMGINLDGFDLDSFGLDFWYLHRFSVGVGDAPCNHDQPGLGQLQDIQDLESAADRERRQRDL